MPYTESSSGTTCWAQGAVLRGVLTGLLAALLAVASAAAAPQEEPRELSAAERQAVVFAADYLSTGPEAWWPSLAESSPLRARGRDFALQAMEVRAGPPEGARWRLQTVPEELAADSAVFTIEFPSGLDEILTLRLARDGGTWRIHDLHMAAEPAAGRPAGDDPPAPVHPAGSPAEGAGDGRRAPLLLAACALVLLWIAARRRDAGGRLRLAAMGVLAAALILAYFRWPRESAQEAPATVAATADVEADVEAEIAGLLRLRRDLAGPEAAGSAASLAGAAARVARTWQAQLSLAELRPGEAEDSLEALDSPAGSAQAELVRARLSHLRRQAAQAEAAYERALAALPRHDGLLLEAAHALEDLGLERRAARTFSELAALGSREARGHYDLARRELRRDRRIRSARRFRTAWHLRPLPRTEVLRQPELARLIDGMPDLEELLQLGEPAGPQVACEGEVRLVPLPGELPARRLGGLLVLGDGGTRLEVPGGCSLAPPGTESDSAEGREELEGRLALARPRSRAVAHVAQAVAALTRQGRWDEVVLRTEELSHHLGLVPSRLLRQRAEALRRTGRAAAAIELLGALARIESRRRRPDPETLVQLAELLISQQQHERALGLLEKAHAAQPVDRTRQWLHQLRAEQRLIAAAATYESRHFKVHYPRERSVYYARLVADVLEEQRRRLGRWIPVETGEPMPVLLLDAGDRTTGGRRPRGLYGRRIRVPFGGAPALTPRMVSMLANELAHAMIAESTRGQAPHWLQEGLARHLETVQQKLNPIPGLRRSGDLLALPLIDAVLGAPAASRRVPIARDESLWALRFIDSELGAGAIHRLLESFEGGATSEQAIAGALGRSVAELDRELWSWCLDEN